MFVLVNHRGAAMNTYMFHDVEYRTTHLWWSWQR